VEGLRKEDRIGQAAFDLRNPRIDRAQASEVYAGRMAHNFDPGPRSVGPSALQPRA
jgi:hypothetical protein